MKKISYGQLVAILILLRVFSLITLSGTYCTEKMIGVAVSMIFQVLVTLPMLFLYRGRQFDIRKDMIFGRFGFAVYGVFFILWGALSIINLWGVTEVIYLPIGNKIFGAALVTLVAMYGAYLGLRTVGRSAVLAVIFTAISFVVMIVGAYKKVDISNIAVIEAPKDILNYAVDDFFSSGELPSLFLLLGVTGSKHVKGIGLFLTFKFVLTELILFLGITVLGNLMQLTQYPFFAIGAYSQPIAIQRMDSIYMMLFTVLCIITITVQIMLASFMIKEMFPKSKFQEIISTALMILTALLMTNFSINLELICGILIIPLVAIMPIIILFTFKKKAVSK